MSKDKKITMTPRKVKEIKDKAAMQVVTVVEACLMDEFDYTAEDIVKFAERFDRYYNSIEDHIITTKRVREIIEENLGLETRFTT